MAIEQQPQQGDRTEKAILMPDEHVAEGAVVSDKTTQTIFNKANTGVLSTEQTNKLCGSLEIVGTGQAGKSVTGKPAGNNSRSEEKPMDGLSIKDSSPSDRKKPAESEKTSPHYKKGDYRIVYDSPGGIGNIAAATSMDRYHYEEVKEDSFPSGKMTDESLKPLDLSTMGIEIPTSLLKSDISIDKNEVNIAGNDQADKFTTNKPVEKNSSKEQKPIPTDVKSSIESIDRSTKPLRDVANLYRTLDKDRNGLSIAEINTGIQDELYRP